MKLFSQNNAIFVTHRNSISEIYMDTLTLEIEKNKLIRQILDIEDISILKKVRSLLSSEEKHANCVAEEEVPYMTKKEILAGFNDACKDIKLAREGKLQGRPIEDLLNEL